MNEHDTPRRYPEVEGIINELLREPPWVVDTSGQDFHEGVNYGWERALIVLKTKLRVML